MDVCYKRLGSGDAGMLGCEILNGVIAIIFGVSNRCNRETYPEKERFGEWISDICHAGDFGSGVCGGAVPLLLSGCQPLLCGGTWDYSGGTGVFRGIPEETKKYQKAVRAEAREGERAER